MTELTQNAQETLLEFPCQFPLKIMGLASAELLPTIAKIMCKHAANFDPQTIQTRASKAGNYTSLTCTINAVSKAQLDDLYRELSSHPLVKFAL